MAHTSFKSFRENREIIDFGQKYDHLCLAILESGMTFDEFWTEHGLPIFLSNGEANEQILIEGWMDAARGGVAALGTLGKQAIRGGANALSGAARTGYGALQAGAGLGKGALGGGFDTFQNGLSNMGSGLVQAGSGIGQAALAPVSAGIRGYEAGKQNGMGMNTGNQFQQWMGTRQADPNQPAQTAQPPQAQPAQPQQPQQPLSQNQQQAASTAINNIKKAFNDSMTNVVNGYQQSQDSVGYQLAKGFMDKVNAYAEKLQIKRGEGKFDTNSAFSQPQVYPTVGANSTPQGISQPATA
jgi:hypothetical protein